MKTIFHFHLIIISVVFLSVDSCKSKKNTTTDSSSSTTTATPQVALQPEVALQPITTTTKEEGTARFVVSFYSIGEGIDGKVNDEFVKFLDSYTKKIAYTPTHWGREGETDYCLALTELSSVEQTEFVKKANELLSKSKLVHLKENSICDHTNRPAPIISTADDSYRFVVEFYSIGEGVDYKVKEAFEIFLNSYPKKIAFEPTPWGREGEIDYCLSLSELSSTEQNDFVKKAKDVLSKSKLVHSNENAPCLHKQ
ncbi:MAG: hypothetical protein AABZ32_06510 [Bacteroidota bacterium]